MRRAALIVLVVAFVSACGKPAVPLYTLGKTRTCLVGKGATIDQKLDFVASTATGGAFRAHVPGNSVTVVFGVTASDADNINDAYHRFRGRNVGIADVLRQQGNAVMLWHEHPSNADLNLVQGCLK